jgi:hypothetical protein
METEYLGKKKGKVGIEVIDENDSMHTVEVGLDDGGIIFHGTDDYPHKREDRTQEEQAIMSQVEARAQYAAQQEFPQEDILTPMWNPHHIERGLDAFSNYPLDDFHDEFHDFYNALQDPSPYVDDPDMVFDTVVISKPARLQNDRITDVERMSIAYNRSDGTGTNTGRHDDYPPHELLLFELPPLDFEDHITFKDHFHEILVNHLMAQIRDCYLHMGEQPPREYRVEGIGKLDIHGDGVGHT